MKATAIFTKEDLEKFRQQLFKDIKSLLGTPREQVKQWLKSAEARKSFKISTRILQNLGIKGTLHHSHIGIIIYYKADDINKLPEGYLNN